MRILQVMAGGRHGGAELFYEDLVLALARAGVQQSCAIRPYRERAAKLTAAGCPVTTMAFGGPLDFISPWRLQRLAEKEKPSVILGWMNRACRMLPVGPWVNVGRLGGYYDLKYYRRCVHLICNAPDIVSYVVRKGWPGSRAHYIPNFCAVGLEPAVDRASLNTPSSTKVLLILARLHESKGVDVALRALALIPDAVLWIAGEGPLESALKKLAVELRVAERVRFLGWRSDRTALLKAADVCLVPSRHEPFGNVVVNAWAHGTPLVAADIQGPGFLVTDGADGLKVPAESPEALASAVNAILVDPGLGNRLVEGGRARAAAEFSEPAVVGRYREFLQALSR